MSINLQFNPSASDVLNFALSGFPFANASFYGNTPQNRSALFTNGLAAGFPLDRGALFTSNSVQFTQSSPRTNFDGSGGSVGISFDLLPNGAQTTKTVQISWCSCDEPGFDFGSLVSPGQTTQRFDVNLPADAPLMPQNQIAGSQSGQITGNCRCRSDSQPFVMDVGGLSSMGMSFDGLDNSFFFIGQSNDPDLVTTTQTSYVSTITITETISTETTSTTTSPFTYSTTTITPVGETLTVTPSVVQTITVPSSTITVTPAVSTYTSIPSPTCTLYQLTFDKECCPKKQCKKGAIPYIKPPFPTPAPNHQKKKKKGGHYYPYNKRELEEEKGENLIKRQDPGPLDPPASSTISDGTMYITSFRTSTTQAPLPTTTTLTIIETSTESILASETAAVPDQITITSNSTMTIPSSITSGISTSTLKPITTTYVAPATCTKSIVPTFYCPRGAKIHKNLQKAEKDFLDSYKRLTTPQNPNISVYCTTDPEEYYY